MLIKSIIFIKRLFVEYNLNINYLIMIF